MGDRDVFPVTDMKILNILGNAVTSWSTVLQFLFRDTATLAVSVA